MPHSSTAFRMIKNPFFRCVRVLCCRHSQDPVHPQSITPSEDKMLKKYFKKSVAAQERPSATRRTFLTGAAAATTGAAIAGTGGARAATRAGGARARREPGRAAAGGPSAGRTGRRCETERPDSPDSEGMPGGSRLVSLTRRHPLRRLGGRSRCATPGTFDGGLTRPARRHRRPARASRPSSETPCGAGAPGDQCKRANRRTCTLPAAS